MKKNNNQNLDDFEKYLLQSVKERPKIPFSTEEVLQILESYNPPDGLEELRDGTVVQVMKEEYSTRAHQEQKLKNLSLIHSLGELIQTYYAHKNISPIRLAQVVGLSKEDFENYKKDEIAPELFKKQSLLNLMLLIGIPINEMIQILEKTAKLFRIKQDTRIVPSYARMNKGLEDSSKMLVRDSAMKELLLTLKDEEETENDEFEKLKDELVTEYEKIQSESENFGRCYTIRTRQQSDKINKILEQL